MINGKKCIGVLTSGGDSPGMNAAIRAVVRSALTKDMIPLGVIKGYQGLLDKDFVVMNAQSVSNIIQKGGTILKSARCMEFYEDKYRRIAYQNAIDAGIDGLVVIGGDGSYNGAKFLSELGLPCIGLPGTIDNDIACTEYTIGFDTAMNTVIENVDKLNDISKSHERCSVVEVMGRNAGHVALGAGIATGAIAIMTNELDTNIEDVAEHIKKARAIGKDHFIVIVSEGYSKAKAKETGLKEYEIPNSVAHQIQEQTGVDSRATILGHVQRGGSPSLRDRVVATQMGHAAVELLEKGIGNRVIALKNNKIVDFDIQEALQMKKGLDMDLYQTLLDTTF